VAFLALLFLRTFEACILEHVISSFALFCDSYTAENTFSYLELQLYLPRANLVSNYFPGGSMMNPLAVLMASTLTFSALW
jgi:hypothetical protein